MKKRILGLITAVVVLFGLSVFFAACKEEKADYSVTVLSPAETPVSNVTVKWNSASKTAGSAKTGTDGKATAELPLGSYTIELSDLTAGHTYTPVTVSATMREVELTLSVAKVTYTATVTDKTGTPASGVSVTWSTVSLTVDDTKIVGTATTNASGIATCELDYGDYSVTVANLPDGNVYTEGARTVSGNSPAAAFALRDGVSVSYSVTVRSEGGLLFKKHPVLIYDGNTLLTSGNSNDSGVYTFSAVAGTYSVRTSQLPTGYAYAPATLTNVSRSTELVLLSEIIPVEYVSSNTQYVIGDIFHDYSFKTPYQVDGKYWESSVSEILKTKEVLIINNWGINCSWCVTEMESMQEAYEKFSDVVELVAVSNYAPADTNSDIVNFHASHSYTFPMMRDTNGFATKFGISGWPTTVIIDRYGAIARIESGAVTSPEAWERMILKYVGDDYVQTFTPGDRVSDSINQELARPDITAPEGHYEALNEVLNDTNLFPVGASVVWSGEEKDEMAWPFWYGTVEGVSDDPVVYTTNTGKANSYAVLYATVNVAAGKVFTFDYYSDTEADCDILSFVWDGRIVKQISGKTEGWTTCYLYADIADGEHSLALAYIKDGSKNVGKDNVYLRNVRFVEIEDMQGSADMLRCAAYGTPDENATTFPYYAEVALDENDGYYHVNTSALQNAAMAGDDDSPLLLANLMNATPWSPTLSISELAYGRWEETGEYVVDCNFTIDGVTRDYREDLIVYLNAAKNSEVSGCVPVNKKLHDMLVEFMKKLSGEHTHEKEWLEICYFYSHYGTDTEPIGNPILGLLPETAVAVEEDRYTVDLTRNIAPFPFYIYSFTPETSAVYLFETYIPENAIAEKQQASHIWLFDDATSAEKPLVECGPEYIVRDGVNEYNFKLYRYLEVGHKYYVELAFQMQQRGTYDFSITNVGASATQFVPASSDAFTFALDDKGNITNQVILGGAVDYKLCDDGYYHAINPDKTEGNIIYLDLKYAATSALGSIPIERLADRFFDDPLQDADKPGVEFLDYKFFDFRYRVVFYRNGENKKEDEEEIINYNPKVDCTGWGEEYRDYTDVVLGWLEAAPKDGEFEGMIPVTQEVVDVMTLYIAMRVNPMYLTADGEIDDYDPALSNEWLRFCWYTRIFDENNP